MNSRRLTIFVSGLVLLLVVVGVVGAYAYNGRLPSLPGALGETVSNGITYQGRLTNSGGGPLNGTVSMRFVVYDDEVDGSAQWNSGNMNVAVEDGLFTVKLGVDAADFDGQALWLSVIVEGQVLSPRQEITPAPYALGLRPGADIVGDAIGAADAVLAGYAPATGTALHAEANGGVGVFGVSRNDYGVWGESANSSGGFFTSQDSYGVSVASLGSNHWAHAGTFSAEGGYGIFATSTSNMAVRGEAGDVAGIAQPLGSVGVVGIGSNRGAYGASQTGSGLHGTSDGNYGLWAQSTDWRGATGRTSRPDNNYGFYTPDNMFASNYQSFGAFMAIMQNGGSEPLSAGDVVVFSGLAESVPGVDSPLAQVSRAGEANSTAVAGVVFSRFNIEAINPVLEAPDDSAQGKLAEMEVTPSGNAGPGDYVLVVVQGPAQVKASALESDPIQPGDLLSSAGSGGLAAKAQMVSVSGIETAVPGTIFGKALESYQGEGEMIMVYVTLQ